MTPCCKVEAGVIRVTGVFLVGRAQRESPWVGAPQARRPQLAGTLSRQAGQQRAAQILRQTLRLHPALTPGAASTRRQDG